MFTEASAPQPLYTESLDPKAKLGALFFDDHGRVWRYARAGAVALAGGVSVQSATTLTSTHVSGRTTSAGLAASAQSIGKGDKFMRIITNTTSFSSNDFADGLLAHVTSTSGMAVPVTGHAPVTTSSSTSGDIRLRSPVPHALTAGASRGMIYSNLYNGVIITPNPPTKPVLGLTQHDVTAAYYFWVLTRGIGICRRVGTPVEGQMLMPAVATSPGYLSPWVVSVSLTSASTPETMTADQTIVYQPVGVTVLHGSLQTHGNLVLLNLP